MTAKKFFTQFTFDLPLSFKAATDSTGDASWGHNASLGHCNTIVWMDLRVAGQHQQAPFMIVHLCRAEFLFNTNNLAIFFLPNTPTKLISLPAMLSSQTTVRRERHAEQHLGTPQTGVTKKSQNSSTLYSLQVSLQT